ncbi:MAG TPA: thermonuclease family protein [Devosiaceae bacterium]
MRGRSNTRLSSLLSLVALMAFFGAVAWLAVQLEPASLDVSGAAHVADGDTLTIGKSRVRLLGIDAPEYDQICQDASGHDWACGTAARDLLRQMIGKSAVTCDPEGHDQYGRVLARCAANKRDLGGAMIDAGLAISYDDYKLRETAARLARKGLWAGHFDTPRTWRDSNGHPDEGFDFWAWAASLFG